MQRQTLNSIRAERRGGAVIVVVLTLLASLAFLGFFFYSWSDQEAKSARAFAFERLSDDETDGLNILDDALRQIILATPDTRPQSALHGGQITNGVDPTFNVSDKSMLAHMLGLIRSDGTPEDVRPRNGTGIAVYGLAVDGIGMPIANTATDVAFDYDGDGVPDADGTDFRLNTSAAANVPAAGANPFERFGTALENSRPDVDYTYPDVNAQFIAYDAVLPGGQRVIIPSFFRPQLFPNKRSAGFGDIYTDTATAGQVLRPHIDHRNSDGSLRYIDPVNWPVGRPALSGDLSRVIAPFPFTVDADTNTVSNEMGVFSGSTQYDLDADADGDGVLDSIWLDLGYPIIDLADGRQVVPIFYTKIVDLDSLLNVNHHGHAPVFTRESNYGNADPFVLVYSLTNGWIHASNLGLSPAEINLLPALRADPNDPAYLDAFNFVAATQQHRGLYSDQTTGPPTDRTTGFTWIQMANTELLRLLIGSPQYEFDLTYSNPNPASDIPGRYGEAFALRPALAAPGPGTFPAAGAAGFDDDGDDGYASSPPGPTAPSDNIASGVAHTDDFGGLLVPPLVIPPSVHPLDFSGLGNWPPISTYYPGRSVSYRSTPGNGGIRDLAGIDATSTNPSRWLLYGLSNGASPIGRDMALWSCQVPDMSAAYPVAGVTPWHVLVPPNPTSILLQHSFLGSEMYDGLWNENDEIVTDNSFPTAVDEPFPVSEAPALQLSDADWLLASSNSRLRKLASLNFEANKQAESIRKQFTTDSRDRLEHGFSRVPIAEDANGNGILDPGEDTNGNGLLDDRRWEFNDTFFAPNEPRFPPAFGGGITSRHEGANPTNPPGSPPVIDAADPFRPVVRRLLTVEQNNQVNISADRYLAGQRLNLNRLLVNFDRNGNPIYRHLTPHATFDGTETDTNTYLWIPGTGTVRPLNHGHNDTQSYYDDGQALSLLDADIPAPTSGPAFAPVPFSAITTDKFAQEAWARYDRQRLARDIYVLLYTLGAPDSLNPTVNPYPIANAATDDVDGDGIPDIVEAMAQFAVNYVDALDQDDVITRFEYDPDLSDGWNTVTPWPTQQVVYGVEAQQLTFSEAQWVRTEQEMSDFPDTIYPDDDQVHQFLHIELRNAGPFTIDLNTGTYRIVRVETEGLQVGTPSNAVEFKRVAGVGSLTKSVGPGQNFLVGTHDGSILVHQTGSPSLGEIRSSDLYFNTDTGTPAFEAHTPRGPDAPDPTTSTAPDPLCDLDLCHANDANYFTERTINTLTGLDEVLGTKLVGLGPTATSPESKTSFALVLQRQLNPHASGMFIPDSTVDPSGGREWVEVDRIYVQQLVDFNPTDNSDIVNQLTNNVKSVERRQPLTLSGTETTTYPITGTPTVNWAWRSEVNAGGALQNHTLDSRVTPLFANDFKHDRNSRQTGPFTVWQPHFDRDFSSAYELLSVPMFSPEWLVERLTNNSQRLSGFYSNLSTGVQAPSTAAAYFEHADGDFNQDNTGLPDDPGEVANRWYRLFEFIEFPPRTHDTIRDGLTLRRRTDGRINLNTLRHEAVLAGLIDDETQLDTLANPSLPTSDRHDPGARNWFQQLLLARDGVDPFTSLPLPGVPGALPFRSMSYIHPQDPDLVIRSTLLRPHRPSGTGAPSDYMQLFEARGTADVQDPMAVADPSKNQVDHHTRNRLLAKIANNTTNRSHLFAIWVGYELFEAHQPALPAQPDVVQIGAKITDIAGHREFVVVDMTRLEEAFVDDPNDTQPGRFDWRKFIIYRKQIR